jgi:hypothetical protein
MSSHELERVEVMGRVAGGDLKLTSAAIAKLSDLLDRPLNAEEHSTRLAFFADVEKWP